MNEIVWEEVSENNDDIVTIAFTDLNEKTGVGRIVGYNGILKGDSVKYNGNVYTVVVVSRLGYMGLSETGELPYTQTAHPNELVRIKKEDEHE